jgi:hypothetical protein
MPGLAGQQITQLLESVPGIASVLRSPVADALVNMIRAGARVGEFRPEDAQELVLYATRRGLIGSDEGERVLFDVRGVAARRGPAVVGPKPGASRGGTRKVTRRPVAKPRRAAARKAKPARRPKAGGKKRKR